ncbi:uncharacterized protein BJ212DRAFT_1297408 [Suillus subaureus]|uniref:Uncharacterized protein n=1 Tax=Suillus subaureus TaxID=48587 RepID=A0A9P7EG58_9AGAM|nr:uncharacterized protein BJ212DRAFT_1297408 [Suillus subaureus]KAG1820927.1 hypothetical protein BJ212DRAFT_1297408 [Suillus subaureus]
MSSQQEANNALSIANASLCTVLACIRCYEADGQSQALQQHGRNASAISLLLLSVATKVQVTMNIGQAMQWNCVRVDDSHMESHPFYAKMIGFGAPALAPVPSQVSKVLLPAPKVMSVPPINSLPVKAPKSMTDKGKQPVWRTQQSREDDSDNESSKKRHKAVVPSTPTPPKSRGVTKEVKQADTEGCTSQPMLKGKAKEIAVDVTEGDEYDPPCKSHKGQIMKSCAKCYVMKDAMEDTVLDVEVVSHADVQMSQKANVTLVMLSEPTVNDKVNQPAAMVLANNFPLDHWQEDTNDIPIPLPLPAAKPTTLAAEWTIHDCMVVLAARVTAMEMANHNTLARVDAMEQEFNACISSMQAKFSAMQLSFNGTVDTVQGLANMVKKLWQECTVLNPSFPPPMMGPTSGSSATAMGVRYLTGVFGPSVTPTANSVSIGQPSASHPFSRPDV